jgi:hypothetical protein
MQTIRYSQMCTQLCVSRTKYKHNFSLYVDIAWPHSTTVILALLFKKMFPYFFCSTSTRFRVKASPHGASRANSLDTPYSVGLPWTIDQPDAATAI